ncbi:MAG: family 16 glycosylhydrolase [Chitinophagales bacterium]
MRIFLFLIAIVFVTNVHGQESRAPYSYHLVWEDNFDSLNTDIWLVQNHFDHYGNERQVYTSRPENVFIDNGQLILRVDRETYSCPPEALHPWGCARQYNTGEAYEFTSGWIETQPEYNTEYGYVEARISLPYGRGFWPAFWTFVGGGLSAHENAAEIDIFEMYGHKPPYISSTNVHLEYCNENYPDYPDCSGIPSYGREHIIQSYTNQYHIYSIEWTPEIIRWKMNDQVLRVMDNPGVVDPVRLIINMAILQDNPPHLTTVFPADIKIDYIKVYAMDEILSSTHSTLSDINIELYPNPTDKKVSISTADKSMISTIIVINALGENLASYHINNQSFELDVSNLPTANYFIQIFTDKGIFTKKLIKN